MIYGLENYEVTDTLELQSIIAELDFELIKESIREQIVSADTTNVNYLTSIEDKYEIIKEEYGEVGDLLEQATHNMEDLYGFIIDNVSSTFSIEISNYDDNFDELAMLARTVYNFLVLNARKNIKKFIYKYITKNKKGLIADYTLAKKKDISSSNLKKMTKNKDDVILISNLPDIFKSIVNMDLEADDLLRYIASPNLYLLQMKKFISEEKIIGNFMNTYLEIIRDDYDLYDDIYSRVYCKLTDKLINKN